jgi:hypothetical protein
VTSPDPRAEMRSTIVPRDSVVGAVRELLRRLNALNRPFSRIVPFALVAAACVHHSPARPDTFVSGYYTPGFEQSRFIACDWSSTDARWWVQVSDPLLSVVDSASRASGNAPYFVRWRGQLSAPGSFGHLGSSTRYFVVTSIEEYRKPAAPDCRPAIPIPELTPHD